MGAGVTTWTAATTTLPTVPPRPALLAVLGRKLATANARTRAVAALLLRLLLTIAGLGGLAAAAWVTFGLGAGIAASAVACLLLEYVVKRP